MAIALFATNQIDEMARNPKIDAFMTVAPIGSKITSDAITSTARFRGERKFLPIEVSEAIAQRHPVYESEEIPGSSFSAKPARPDDKIDTIGVNHLIVAPKSLSETKVSTFTRQLFAVRHSLVGEVPARKISRSRTRTRMPRCPHILERPPTSTELNARSSTDTATTYGSRFCFFPGLGQAAHGCATI